MSTTQETTTAVDDPAIAEVTGKLLQDVKHDIVPYDEAEPGEREKIETLLNEIDMSDSNSIIFFGTRRRKN